MVDGKVDVVCFSEIGGCGLETVWGEGETLAGWHHWLDGRESEWTSGIGDGQGGLACCDSWGHKESDTTKRLNWTELRKIQRHCWSSLKAQRSFEIRNSQCPDWYYVNVSSNFRKLLGTTRQGEGGKKQKKCNNN